MELRGFFAGAAAALMLVALAVYAQDGLSPHSPGAGGTPVLVGGRHISHLCFGGANRLVGRHVNCDVFGADDRRDIDVKTAEDKHLEGLGVIACLKEGEGLYLSTAFLLDLSELVPGAEDQHIIATASHNLLKRAGDGEREMAPKTESECKFVWQNSLELDSIMDLGEIVHGGLRYMPEHEDYSGSRDNFLRDWAFVRLTGPRTERLKNAKGLRPLAVDMKGREEPLRVSMVGLSHSTDRLAVETGCHIYPPRLTGERSRSFRTRSLLPSHSCDSQIGSSGGPVFVQRGDSYYSVGIHVGASGKDPKDGIPFDLGENYNLMLMFTHRHLLDMKKIAGAKIGLWEALRADPLRYIKRCSLSGNNLIAGIVQCIATAILVASSSGLILSYCIYGRCRPVGARNPAAEDADDDRS